MPTNVKMQRFLRNETGATAMEYGLIASIMGLGVIAAANGLGAAVLQIFQFVLNAFNF